MDENTLIMKKITKAKTELENQGICTDNLFFGVRNEVDKRPSDNMFLFNNDEHFIKVFPSELKQAINNLNGTETLTLLAIVPHISYGSGMIKKGNGYPLTLSDISKLTELSERTTVRAIAKLVSKRILFKGRSGEGRAHQFFANPHIFMRGRYINKTLHDMFKNYKIDKSNH